MARLTSRLPRAQGAARIGTGMAAALLVAIGAILAAIALATAGLIESAAKRDALSSAVSNAETFSDLALEEDDIRSGVIRRSVYDDLARAAARTNSVDAVALWGDRRELIASSGISHGRQVSFPPPAAIWEGKTSGLFDNDNAVRTFIPIENPAGDQTRQVLEIESVDPRLEAAIGSRRGTAIAIIAALAAILYVAITPAAMRGASAMAERQGRRHKALQKELRTAMERNEIKLAFQPKGELRSGRLVGVEALARWIHPKRGLQQPLSYFPQIEETALVGPLTLHILELALRRQQEWLHNDLPLDVAVNVPATALGPDGVTEEIIELLGRYRSAECGVTIEVTETAIGDGQLIDSLHQLKRAGARLSLDDFGRGQSSLSRLGSMPFDELKIDREFIAGLDRAGGLVMVRTMLELGHRLGMTVVAEGVEWATTATWLANNDCEVIQGHLLAPPMSPNELLNWVEEGGGARVVEMLAAHRAVVEGPPEPAVG